VNGVGQQSDGSAEQSDRELNRGGQAKTEQRELQGTNPLGAPLQRVVDLGLVLMDVEDLAKNAEDSRAVVVIVSMLVLVVMGVIVAMRTVVVMIVGVVVAVIFDVGVFVIMVAAGRLVVQMVVARRDVERFRRISHLSSRCANLFLSRIVL
jgi:hypothetical protein